MNISVRPLRPCDKEAIVQILQNVPEFSTAEVELAIELIDAYLDEGAKSGYAAAVADVDMEILGYVLYGPTPITQDTWDIYWIAVAPQNLSRGIGSKLLKYAENKIKSEKGRLILIETSSRPIYRNARKFYLGNGYRVICRIPDFYAVGDGKIIYLKKLQAQIHN